MTPDEMCQHVQTEFLWKDVPTGQRNLLYVTIGLQGRLDISLSLGLSADHADLRIDITLGGDDTTKIRRELHE